MTPARIALACLQHAPDPVRSQVLELGLSAQALELGPPPPGAGFEAAAHESIFRRFEGEAKKLLAGAPRSAQAAGEVSISPQRLLIAALGSTPELQAACGEAAARAQRLQPALLADATPAPERNLVREAALDEYLSRLSPRADTLDMLLAFSGRRSRRSPSFWLAGGCAGTSWTPCETPSRTPSPAEPRAPGQRPMVSFARKDAMKKGQGTPPATHP